MRSLAIDPARTQVRFPTRLGALDKQHLLRRLPCLAAGGGAILYRSIVQVAKVPGRLRLPSAIGLASALWIAAGSADAQPYGSPRNQGTAPAGPDIVGTWSGQAPGQGGMNQVSDDYEPDGSFVSVMMLPNGSMTRAWGHYQVSPDQQGQVRIDFSIQGWLPRQVCTQVPGFPLKCGAYEIPRSASATLRFTSPASFQVNGATMSRDPAPPLLRAQVPERYVQGAPAPVQPNIPQPVMPGGRRYVSPFAGGDGGGSSGARCDDNHQRVLCNMNNGNFIRSNGCLVCVGP